MPDLGNFSPIKQPSIFTAKDYERLTEAERKIRDVLPIIERAEKCGINCDGYRYKLGENAAILDAIKTHFMTPPPQ